MKQERWSSDVIIDLYANLLMEIWEVVSELIGEAILQSLFLLAVRKLGGKYPFLNSLSVSEGGISWGKEREQYKNIATLEIHRGFQSLIIHLFDLFSALTEGVISRELFPKVLPKLREAERIISQR